MTDAPELDAGRFSAWLLRIQSADTEGVDVPCGECTACCTSSYFIHVGPDETETLRRIPRELLFPAPGLPEGHLVMGYDDRGHCPMLIDNECSIYEHRPLTCRSYDCRIFPAAALAPGGEEKARITRHVRRWKFSFPDPQDRDQQAAVEAAAVFLRDHPDCFPDGRPPSNPLQLALLAIKIHATFLGGGATPEVGAVTAALRTVGSQLGRPG